jgi:hypothetical protein
MLHRPSPAPAVLDRPFAVAAVTTVLGGGFFCPQSSSAYSPTAGPPHRP